MPGRMSIRKKEWNGPHITIEIGDNQRVGLTVDGLGRVAMEVRDLGKGPEAVELVTQFPGEEKDDIRRAATDNPEGGIRWWKAGRNKEVKGYNIDAHTSSRMTTS